MQEQQKNILIAVLLCAVLWLGVERFLKPSSVLTEETRASESPPASVFHRRSYKEGPHVVIRAPKVHGSLSLRGAMLNQWILEEYSETSAKDSPLVHILSKDPLYAVFFDWIASESNRMDLPTEDTVWQVDGEREVLTPDHPLLLHWKNDKGALFQLIYTLNQEYVLTVKQRVHNRGEVPFTLGTQSKMIRQGPVKTSGYMMLHEGPLGVFSGKLRESSYQDVVQNKESAWKPLGKDPMGWMGLTDKYWLSALIPSGEAHGRFLGNVDAYQMETVTPFVVVKPGTYQETTTHLFLGPKQLSLLDKVGKELSVCHFDLALDFGWFYFLTKPMFTFLSLLKEWVGSFGLAILGMTLLMKILFFPLSLRSYRSMARMKKLQPQLQVIKDRFGGDKMRLNEEMMAFYRKEKINPVSGCLPMLVQIPVFFSLYKVLFVSIEMRQASFWGWIHDLSAPDPTSLFNGFGLLPWSVPHWLHVGLWPCCMGITMWMQQRMNDSPTLDHHQKIMFTYGMPLIFTYMLAKFPVGLVIYWTWSNLITLIQQWIMVRYYEDPVRDKIGTQPSS